MTQYKMFSDEAVAKFRSFAVAAGINQRHPQGAFDAKPKFARDQAVPVEALTQLIEKLLAENTALKKRGMATDAAPLPQESDDVLQKIGKLSDILGAFLTPDKCEEARGIIAEAAGRITQLQKAVNTFINAQANGAGDDDQPPPFEGRPQRDGGLGQDSFRERFPMAKRIGMSGASPRGTRDRMIKNMSRINVIG
jgi:hypothetical protein